MLSTILMVLGVIFLILIVIAIVCFLVTLHQGGFF